MRSFVCSALFIAGVLIGQQWIAKSSEAQSNFAATDTAVVDAGYARWMADSR